MEGADTRFSTLMRKLAERELILLRQGDEGAIYRAKEHRIEWLERMLRELPPETQKGTRA